MGKIFEYILFCSINYIFNRIKLVLYFVVLPYGLITDADMVHVAYLIIFIFFIFFRKNKRGRVQYLCVPRKRYVVSIINTSFTVCLEHMDCYHTVVSSTLHCVLLFVFSKAYSWAHGLDLEPLRQLLQVCLWQLLELCTDPAGSGTAQVSYLYPP